LELALKQDQRYLLIVFKHLFEGLQEFHENWLFHQNSTFPLPAPVLVLDSNLEMENFIRLVQQRKFEIIPRHLMI
jgi:hypothetical protein